MKDISMIISYRDKKRNIYMFDTIYMMLSFIDDVKKEVENKNGFIDKFRFEFNTMWKTEKFQAPTLLPPEKEGETLTEYLTTQKKYDH